MAAKKVSLSVTQKQILESLSAGGEIRYFPPGHGPGMWLKRAGAERYQRIRRDTFYVLQRQELVYKDGGLGQYPFLITETGRQVLTDLEVATDDHA